MKIFDKKDYLMHAGVLACGALLGFAAFACSSPKAPSSTASATPKGSETAAATPEPAKPTEKPTEEPTAEPTEDPNVARIAETGTGVTVVKAADYETQFPLQYTSYMMNNENDEVVEYTETSPYIKTLYEGYGFAKSYGSARGHTYVITDISATGRPHKLANCYTCKTSSFTAEVLNKGDSAYAMAFDDFTDSITDDFGCFHCHGNDVASGKITITHGYLTNAIGDDLANVKAATLSCGQCHTEYYFDPETKATTLSYHGLATMNPDDMLAYENSIVDAEGNMFADWVDEDTGVRKLKVQHPEFETYLGEGSPHAKMNFTCADCHMPEETAEDGTAYTSHYWQSPLDSQDLLDNNCSKCHKDLAAEVKEIQEKTTAREDEIGNALAKFDADLAAAIAEEKLSEEDLESIRLLSRNAQWYWDFIYVENSEGVHNPTLTTYCLDKAQELLDEAYKLLGE